MCKNSKSGAFTLAETLIALIIIGIIAALTVPSVLQKTQMNENRALAKKAFSTVNQALDKTKEKMGYSPTCYYWDENKPYGSLTCAEKDAYGACKKYEYQGGKMPSDWNGPYKDCPKFFAEFFNQMNVIRICKGNAYYEGCIGDIKGSDKTMQAGNPSLSDEEAASKTSGCGSFRDQSIKNNLTAYVLADGTTIMPYSLSGSPILLVDVNGKKGPNLAGYDIVFFMLKGSPQNDSAWYPGGCDFRVKGGKSTLQLLSGN